MADSDTKPQSPSMSITEEHELFHKHFANVLSGVAGTHHEGQVNQAIAAAEKFADGAVAVIKARRKAAQDQQEQLARQR